MARALATLNHLAPPFTRMLREAENTVGHSTPAPHGEPKYEKHSTTVLILRDMMRYRCGKQLQLVVALLYS